MRGFYELRDEVEKLLAANMMQVVVLNFGNRLATFEGDAEYSEELYSLLGESTVLFGDKKFNAAQCKYSAVIKDYDLDDLEDVLAQAGFSGKIEYRLNSIVINCAKTVSGGAVTYTEEHLGAMSVFKASK